MRTTKPVRRLGILLVITAVLAGLLPGSAIAASYEQSESSFIVKLNQERRARGLGGLAINTQMTGVARKWTATMAGQDKLYHNPNLAAQVTGQWRRLGENVGYTRKTGADQPEMVQRLHDAFMASPGHKANVLGDYNQVGVGVTISSNGKMWVTVVFAHAPLPAPSQTGATTPTPTATPTPKPAPLPSVEGQIKEGVGVSKGIFAAAGSPGRNANHVVVGRADLFADALAGAALAGDLGPMLLTPGPNRDDANPRLHAATRAEIDRVLGGYGTVYLLGGPNAISDRAGRELADAGYSLRRLAGKNRIQTAAKIAEQAVALRGSPREVLIVRADDWADAASGGAYAAYTGAPILLTGSQTLAPEVADFLARHRPAQRYVLGGKAAVGDKVVGAAQASRIAGANRYATAVEISRSLWGRTNGAMGDRYVSANGARQDGWAYALVWAPRAAVDGAPQLLVGDTLPDNVAGYLSQLRYGSATPGVIQAASNVPTQVVTQLQQLMGP